MALRWQAAPGQHNSIGSSYLLGCADERHNLSVRGLFYGIGHQPNSGIYGDQLELDEAGYVKVRSGATGGMAIMSCSLHHTPYPLIYS